MSIIVADPFLALKEKHEKVFRRECDRLSELILKSSYKLIENRCDEDEIKNLVQCADTVMGNARFINDVELERSATLIVKSFSGKKDVNSKPEEFNLAIAQFEARWIR